APFVFEGREFDQVATPEDIYYSYRLFLGRMPDRDGWKTYEGVVRGGISVNTLAEDFLASTEFRRRAALLQADLAEPVLADLGSFFMLVDPHDFVGHAILIEGTYEPHVVTAVRSHLSPGGVLLDVGAHVGYFSLIAAERVGPLGRVLSFEPNPASCDLMLRS